MRKQYTVFDSSGKPVRYINATEEELDIKVKSTETYQEGKIVICDVPSEIRLIREPILASSDWTQGADASNRLTQEQIQTWANYRQELCDLPAKYADATSLEEVIWPVAP